MRGHYSLHGPSKKQMLALHQAQVGAEAMGGSPQFQPVLDALNVLGRTPWIINEPVLRVMEEVWATGGGRAGVPPRKIRRTRRGRARRTDCGSVRGGTI